MTVRTAFFVLPVVVIVTAAIGTISISAMTAHSAAHLDHAPRTSPTALGFLLGS